MYKTIYANLMKNGIDLNGKKVVAGFSGGPDSMFLAHFLIYCRKYHKTSFKMLYMNHMERDEVLQEEKFIKKFCMQNSIELELCRENVPSSKSRTDFGFEMAARNARRKALTAEFQKTGADFIFTGHNADDLIETFFINIDRGSGIRGLNAMKLKSGFFVKPLIFIEKDKIAKYLDNRGIEYITDKTNNDIRIIRNNIRKNLTPFIKKEFKNGFSGFLRFFKNIEETVDLFDFLIFNNDSIIKDNKDNNIILDISNILLYNNKLRKTLLYYILSKKFQVDSSLIDEILKITESKKGFIEIKLKGLKIVKKYSVLEISKSKEEIEQFKADGIFLNVGKEKQFNSYKIGLKRVNFIKSMLKDKNIFVFPVSSGKIFKVRVRAAEDIFIPFGLNRTVKIKKFLINLKVPKNEREDLPLLVNEKNEILAVSSLRRTGLYPYKNGKECLIFYAEKN